jgi:hypothetical protein
MVQRTSYQDSNIFGYKDNVNPTIQPKAAVNGKDLRQRNNNTFVSRIFQDQGNAEEPRTLSKNR